MSWFDVDGDGHEDLFISAARRTVGLFSQQRQVRLIVRAVPPLMHATEDQLDSRWHASDGAGLLVASDKFENAAGAGGQQISLARNSGDVLAKKDTPASGGLWPWPTSMQTAISIFFPAGGPSRALSGGVAIANLSLRKWTPRPRHQQFKRVTDRRLVERRRLERSHRGWISGAHHGVRMGPNPGL